MAQKTITTLKEYNRNNSQILPLVPKSQNLYSFAQEFTQKRAIDLEWVPKGARFFCIRMDDVGLAAYARNGPCSQGRYTG